MLRTTSCLRLSHREQRTRGLFAFWPTAIALVLFNAPAFGGDLIDKEIRLDIRPNTALDDALIQWGAKTGMQVMIATNSVAWQTTPGVKGVLPAGTALSALLQDSGLVYFAKGNTVAVVPVKLADGEARSDSEPSMKRSAADGSVESSAERRGGSSRRADAAQGSRATNEETLSGLEQVVVTAQKREERLIDVPISIVAINADELQKRDVNSLDDLSFAVPGLTIQSGGAGQRRIELRGISNTFGNTSLIGLYLDEASMTSRTDAQLDVDTYDLERAEVLRGPQGTLYGEGSAGGTIRLIANNPALNAFQTRADVAAFFTQDGEPGQRVNAMLNIPVVDNVLGFRIAGTYDHAGGWIDQPAAQKGDFNSQNLINVRAKGLWRPIEDFSVNAMAVVHRNNESSFVGEDASGDYTQSFNLTTTPRVADDYELYNITLAYDLSSFRILSTTSYLNQEKLAQDFGFGVSVAGPPATTPRRSVYYSPQGVRRRARVATEELRFSSTGQDAWQWTLGGYYQRFRYNFDLNFSSGFAGPPGSPVPAPFSIPQMSESAAKAVFGDTSYKVTERLTLGTGVRYYKDDQEAASGFAIGAPATLGPTQTAEFTTTNPRFYAQYKLTDQFNTYASASKGFRSGGFNALNQPSYGPETVRTYELGAKTVSWGGRLRADLAVFYTDYTNYQVVGILPPPAPSVAITSNAGSAKIKGVEWGFTWHPTDRWTLIFNGDYLDHYFYEINTVGNSSAYRVGDGLDLVPKYELTASLERSFEWGGKRGFGRLDYNETARETYRNRSIGPWYFSESGIANLLNLNMGLDWNESLSFGLFAQNLLNDRDFIDPYAIDLLGARSRPRTVGVEFQMKFE